MAEIEGTARQLQLDLLAIECSRALSAAAIPHAVIKGVTTAMWLYHPPRTYRDVDLLVPRSRAEDAVQALIASGTVVSSTGKLGEEASHSLVLVSAIGAEVDLHVSLPTMRTPESGADADRIWQALAAHLEDFELDGRTFPALGIPARCVVLALHVVASGHLSAQVREDLRRAKAAAGPEQWRVAELLADELEVREKLDSALRLVETGSLADASAETALWLGGGNAAAIQLERLLQLPAQRIPAALWREAVPSRLFIRRMFPELATGRAGLARGYLRRLAHLVRSLPAAVRQVRAARRQSTR